MGTKLREPTNNYIPNATTKMFDNLNIILYLFGLRNFWVDEVKLPKKFVKVFDALYIPMYVLQCSFNCLQIAGMLFHDHLTPNQYYDSLIFGICQPITHLFSFYCIYQRKRFRRVLYYLAVVLREVYNDEDIERTMIKSMRRFLGLSAMSAIFNWVYYGTWALIDMVQSGAMFIAVITVWPDVLDTSTLAIYVRLVFYVIWLFTLNRMTTSFYLILLVFIGVSYQYTNLHSYFESLNTIFEETQLSHEEMETKFEAALDKGIVLHSQTLWCAQEVQNICTFMSSSIVLTAMGILPVILNCKTMTEYLNHLSTFLMSMVVTGLIMVPAGDITVEAQKLPDAIFGCGWYNCYGKRSARVRSKLVVALIRAQKPVLFTAFGMVELSHKTFLSILKTTYSLVSVFY